MSGALCLGVGFTAITNGWVHVPTSSSLSDVKSKATGEASEIARYRRVFGDAGVRDGSAPKV